MDKKIFTIQIDGIEKSYNDVLSLVDALKQLDNSNTTVTASTKKKTETVTEDDKAQKQYQATLDRIAKLEEDATKQQIAATQTLRERKSVVEQEVKANTAAEGSIKQMGAQLSLLRKHYDNLSKSERESEEVGGKLLKRIQELDAAYKEAKESTGRFQDSVGNYEKATASLTEQAAQFKASAGELEDKLALMISQGVAPASKKSKLRAKKAGEPKGAINEAANTVDTYASSTKGLASVVNVGESLTAAFGTATGVMSMFGVSGEEVAEQIAKLQGVMATLQSLQVLQENITKKGTATNLLYSKALKVLGLDHKKNTASLAAETAAQGANTVATNAATVATKTFSKALIATGIGAIVVLLGLLIANFSEIKDWFLKLIAPIDGFKAALAGIGSVITNYIVAPFKALFKLMKGDFSGAVDEFKKGFDVMGNYAEGKNKQIAKDTEERNRKFIEGALQTTDTLIKNNEAKYGSDYKYTEQGKKLYDKYFAYQLSLYKGDKEKYAEVQREKWAYDREYNEKLKEAEKKKAEDAKKAAEDAKKIADERKKQLEDYKKSLDSFNKEAYALSIANEEKLIAVQKKAAKTSDEVALAYGKEAELLKQKNEDEKKKIEEQYNELIKKAEKLKQDTTKITEAKNARIKELEETQKADLVALETEKTEAINKINEDAKKKKVEETQKALDSELKLMNSHYTSIQDLTKNAVKKDGKFDLIDVDATKANYKKIGEELNKYLDNLNSSKDRISKYYDDMAGLYSKNSQEYKDLQEKKQAALNDIESKIKVTNKNIEDNTQASTQVQQQYFADLAEKVGKVYEGVNELLSGAFDAAQSIFDMQLEEAQEKLDEVTEAYDEAVSKKEESNARLAELEEEAKTATGGRAIVVQEQIAREMEANKELAKQEKELAKEKEKREKEIAKIEKKQKKASLVQSLVTGIAQSALGVLQALAGVPFPANIVAAALVGSMGAIQTGIISAQIAKLEDGGLLNGKRHKDGGIPVGNTGIEVEGGEYVVNRISTQKNLGLIEYINTSRKEIQVNDVVSYFNRKGNTSITPAPTFKVQYETGGQLANLDTVGAATANDNRILDAINSIDFKPSVSVKEIQDVQSRMTSVRELAGASN
ncbi:hypothetical protein M075_1692 [Bacteroides fragilis str. 20793-3]|nr:hypothetical protein M075_1692 [Bacteroides fragilis str. 20793-3]